MSPEHECLFIRKRFPGEEAEGVHGQTQAHDGHDARGDANERRPWWNDGTRRYPAGFILQKQ